MIVTLCGSVRFKGIFETVAKLLTLEGHVVLMPCVWDTHTELHTTKKELKSRLDLLHLEKIRMCDLVLVINPFGYIGSSTKNEIAYATEEDKPIRYFCKEQHLPFLMGIEEGDKP